MCEVPDDLWEECFIGTQDGGGVLEEGGEGGCGRAERWFVEETVPAGDGMGDGPDVAVAAPDAAVGVGDAEFDGWKGGRWGFCGGWGRLCGSGRSKWTS